MISELKRKVRKNKILSIILKVPYRAFRKIINYPRDKKDSKLIINKLSSVNSDKKKRIWYFCVAMHPNLGDQAQNLCIRRWLDNYYNDYEVVEIPTDPVNSSRSAFLKILKKQIALSDLIIFQSGYCITDSHPDERVHRLIIEHFPDNKIVFFPQTILFTSEKQKAITERIYNRHKRITLMARDKVSYETAKKMFKTAEVLLYPDIVTSLIGKYRYQNQRQGILFCMRNDSEQYYEKSQIADLRRRFLSITRTDITDTTISVGRDELVKNIKGIIESTFEKFSNYKLVITDRYHGTIFSLISQTPVIVIDSTDHKLSSGVDWFKGVYDNCVYYARSLEDAYKKACEILQRECEYNIDDYFDKNYYQKLYLIIERGAV
ncbi:MAG: polysaccharide pyruvyl transferase family protein [Bacillota bacterium]